MPLVIELSTDPLEAAVTVGTAAVEIPVVGSVVSPVVVVVLGGVVTPVVGVDVGISERALRRPEIGAAVGIAEKALWHRLVDATDILFCRLSRHGQDCSSH